jgi:DNA-binding transcriptional ArsR family regulator
VLRYRRNVVASSRTPGAAGIVPVASLLADSTRAAMLTALYEGRPLAAGELARLAGVTPATASAHLARLLEAHLVTVVSQRRHRYYTLAGDQVAAALEALWHLSPGSQARALRASQRAAELALARTCYDHLAGRIGVALLEALLARRILVTPAAGAGGPGATGSGMGDPGTGDPGAGGPGGGTDGPRQHPRFTVTAPGEGTLGAFGIDVAALRKARRRFAGECPDWTERKPHLNGALGAAITGRLLELGWIERAGAGRAVAVTPVGSEGLMTTFGLPPGGLIPPGGVTPPGGLTPAA